MHVCPTGHMSGFHKHNNDLLCYTSGVISNVAFSEDDYNTTRSGMHACPEGTAMVGIHVDHDVLKCAGGGIIVSNSEYISYGGAGSLRYGMHACPEGWIMTGIHVVGNRFLCSWLNH
jgi:ferredoxin